MQDEKKTDPPGPASSEAPKPLVTRIIEAVIDAAAGIAKAVAIRTLRLDDRFRKTASMEETN